MAYRSEDRSDRWKAAVAVLLVHVVLGAVIVTGLNVEIISRAVERLETFDISVPQDPPPEEPPPPRPEPDRAPEEAGDPGKKADPTPIVAPKPEIRLPIPSPVATSRTPGTGTASTSGTGTAGTGTGAGGSGSGRGGGGSDYSKFTPARLVRNLTQRDYRQLAAGRLPTGRAMVSLRVEPNGSASNCRVVRSSGDSTVDQGLCPLITRRLHFRPALDDRGRPIAYRLEYVATWRL